MNIKSSFAFATLLLAFPASLSAQFLPGQEPATPSAVEPPPVAPGSVAGVKTPEEVMKEAEALGGTWMKHVLAGDIRAAMENTWGYKAFEDQGPQQVAEILEAQLQKTGKLRKAWLIHDRSQLQQDTLLTQDMRTLGRIVVLRYISEYENEILRERITCYEPEMDGKGLRIIGMHREAVAEGDLGAWDMGVALGEAVLLRWSTLPEERWRPYLVEAGAIAAKLKVALPPLPDADGEPAARLQAALEFLRGPAVKAVSGLKERPAALATAALTAWSLLLSWNDTEPDLKTADAFAGLMRTAKLDESLWREADKSMRTKPAKPGDKPGETEIWTAVHTLAVNVSESLLHENTPEGLSNKASSVLVDALRNGQRLGNFRVTGAFTTPDGKVGTMEGTLHPSSLDLTVKGFDGTKWRRIAIGRSAWISREGKAWEASPDVDASLHLSAVLKAPLNPDSDLLRQQKMEIVGVVDLAGESATHIRRTDHKDNPPFEYWVVRDPLNGPVVRKVHIMLAFGDVKTEATMTFADHGRAAAAIAPVN